MKKTYINQNKSALSVFLICVCLFLFNFFTGCGLEEYLYIDEKEIQVQHYPYVESLDVSPYYTESDPFELYVEFSPANNDPDSQDGAYLGTDVYYKIYNSISTAASERSNLINIANSSTSSGSATKMIETYEYKQIRLKDYFKSVLFAKEDNYEMAKIRLTNYYDEKACVMVKKPDEDYVEINGNGNSAPLRNSDELTFDFGRRQENSTINKIPVETDDDVKLSSEATYESTWFVNLFAVRVFLTSDYNTQYSEVIFLGTFPIKDNEENN